MNRTATLASLLLAGGLAAPAQAQPAMRSDAIWARATSETMALDGVLNEAGWSTAQSFTLVYGQRAGDPGSGYHDETASGVPPNPTQATVRFLVQGNQLYLGATVMDNSIGGSREFNRFDGLLMSLKDAAVPTLSPLGPSEYLYSWWHPEVPAGQPIPTSPGFRGRFGFVANDPSSRTPEQVAAWDARTVVNGTPNDDAAGPDVGYTVEMRFDLTSLGFNVAAAGLHQVPFSLSVYDVDNFFPGSTGAISANRVWWQNPFGNAVFYNEGRIFIDPAVTTTSALPAMPPDLVIPNGGNFPDITVDGRLDEAVWASGTSDTEIRFVSAAEDSAAAMAIRRGYPGIGPLFSAQFQADLDNDEATPLPAVIDPANATIRRFFKGDVLYIGVDVRDALVASTPDENRWDGFRISVNHRTELQPEDHVLLPRDLAVRISSNGGGVAERDLPLLLDQNPGSVRYAIRLKPGSTLNNPSDVDTGYQIEMAINLTALGYPPGRGDGVLFSGASLSDYDTFDDPLNNYGTRTWFFRERASDRAASYGYMDPNTFVVSNEGRPGTAAGWALRGVSPNPVRATTSLRYALPAAGDVTVDVYDVLGKRVMSVPVGAQAAGDNTVSLEAAGLAPGVYLYRVRLDGVAGAEASPAGRFTVVR